MNHIARLTLAISMVTICLLPIQALGQILLSEIVYESDNQSMTALINTRSLLSDSDIRVELPDRQTVVLSSQRIDRRSDDSISWFGSFRESGAVTAHFAIVNGYASGRIELENLIYEISPVDRGRVRISVVQEPEIPYCHVSSTQQTGTMWKRHNFQLSPAVRNDDGSIVDVLVVYTPQAEAGAGGASQILSVIQSAVDAMNVSLVNSGVPTEIHLAHAALVNYNDSGNSSTDLNFVRNSSEVATLRDIHRADMVGLIVNSTDACGRGYVMRNPGPGFAGSAFQVTARGCAVGNLSFAHEFGHNMGLEHNPESSSAFPNNGSYPWSYGHYHNGDYRTVMSYSSNCPNGCTRRQYFSNPDVSFNGLPTGIEDERDNARSLTETRLVVAQFRENITRQIIFEDSFE